MLVKSLQNHQRRIHLSHGKLPLTDFISKFRVKRSLCLTGIEFISSDVNNKQKVT